LLVCLQHASGSGAQLPRRVAVWKSLRWICISRCLGARPCERGEEVALPRQRVTLASAPCESVPALIETLSGCRGLAVRFAICTHAFIYHLIISYYYCALPPPCVFLLRARREPVAGTSRSPAEACVVISLLVPCYWVCPGASRHGCWARREGRP
jgi:hypothetical protein